jgi:hypothetical protein
VEIARPLPDDVCISIIIVLRAKQWQDDPIVEYEDEFGRMRTARQSEVPRNLVRPTEEPEQDEDE